MGGITMEVVGGNSILVCTLRKGTDLLQLVLNEDENAYYIHHRRQGELVCYDYIADNLGEATDEFQKYLEQHGGKLRD
jgi:hypothetical protein